MKKLKGIVLSGGNGTRLLPLTKVINKSMLPVYDKPMIYYPIQTLVNAGVEDIMVVVGGNNTGEFISLLEDGSEFGLKDIQFRYQKAAGGIAQALALTEYFAGGDPILVVLGDNLIEFNITEAVESFKDDNFEGSRVFLKEVDDATHFGVPVFNEQDSSKIDSILEKPEDPPNNFAVIGIYLYDNSVYDICKTLKPSSRGELEITDVNNAYIEQGKMKYNVLNGWWIDAGSSCEKLFRASELVRETGANSLTY